MHDPRMIRQLFHRDTGFSVDIQATVQDVQATLAQGLLDVGLDLVLAFLDQLDGLAVVGALERQVAVKHAVEDDAARPYVNSAVDLVVFRVDKTLRSHVSEGASIKVLPSHEIHGTGNTKVNNLDLLFFRVDQQDIFQFEIPVNKINLMAVQHAFNNLLEESVAGIFVKPAPLNNIVEQFTTLEEFHNDGDLHVFEGEAVVDFDDVFVAQGFEDLGLDEDGVDVAY
jgi:hypothetical protein